MGGETRPGEWQWWFITLLCVSPRPAPTTNSDNKKKGKFLPKVSKHISAFPETCGGVDTCLSWSGSTKVQSWPCLTPPQQTQWAIMLLIIWWLCLLACCKSKTLCAVTLLPQPVGSAESKPWLPTWDAQMKLEGQLCQCLVMSSMMQILNSTLNQKSYTKPVTSPRRNTGHLVDADATSAALGGSCSGWRAKERPMVWIKLRSTLQHKHHHPTKLVQGIAVTACLPRNTRSFFHSRVSCCSQMVRLHQQPSEQPLCFCLHRNLGPPQPVQVLAKIKMGWAQRDYVYPSGSPGHHICTLSGFISAHLCVGVIILASPWCKLMLTIFDGSSSLTQLLIVLCSQCWHQHWHHQCNPRCVGTQPSVQEHHQHNRITPHQTQQEPTGLTWAPAQLYMTRLTCRCFHDQVKLLW